MQHVKIGDICDNSKVARVDKGSGLLLEIPSTPLSTPAYVSVCQVSVFWHLCVEHFKILLFDAALLIVILTADI